MSQSDQKPIRCAMCGCILSQIEPDESTEHKSLHWGQQQDYWSVELHSWTKNPRDYYEPESYQICSPCKQTLIDCIKGVE